MNTSRNDYSAAEAVLLGDAQEIIGGTIKGILVDDCPNQGLRTIVPDDIE